MTMSNGMEAFDGAGQGVDRIRQWSQHVASLGVDTLVDAGLVPRDDFERASAIVAEEILVRLSLRDYPPRHLTQGGADD